MIEVEPQQIKRGDKEAQQRIEILLEAIMGSDPNEHNEQGTYDTNENFSLHHNLNFKRAVPVQFSICNVTDKISLDPMDANDRKILDLLHEKLNLLPKQLREKAKASTRGNILVSERTYNSSRVWVPNRYATPVYSNQVGSIGEDVDGSKNLKDQFKKNLCKIQADKHRHMAACNIFGYGCSKEGTVMIEAGIVKALLSQSGLSIGNEKIAQALPSNKTLYRYEAALAADCILKVCHEIKLDHEEENVIKLCLITDHGHKEDQDHFVKLVCWAGFNEDRNLSIKYHCHDIEESGHSTNEAVKAIKTLSELFIEVIKEMASDNVKVKIAHITGNSGGGATSTVSTRPTSKLTSWRKLARSLAVTYTP